ncbi:MAG: dTDP-4-dehydrorhamnose reductase [Alteromonas sp.]|nr:dTDP-4-dehydrorhamnose reductase [Alteromonas sp.]
MKKILVTGANGQLGKCLRDAEAAYPNFKMTFVSREALDINHFEEVTSFFNSQEFDYCINAAAYTNVDGAENDKENAFLANAEAVKNLALICERKNIVLLHVSTDYVFDGTKRTPYEESDPTGPINVYGASKLKGEQYIQALMERYFIVRTSWVYSQYGHNFLKSILRFCETKDALTITTEQVGCPTNANDLARALLQIIASGETAYGIYHFSNGGEITWYDFAKQIVATSEFSEKVKVEKINKYPTFAERPLYSVLNNHKINQAFGIQQVNWKESLKNVMAISLNS